jgi:DNA-binding protein HU-beta
LSISARDAGEILDCFLLATREVLDEGREVRWPHFGRIGIRVTPAREGRNPKTGQKTAIAAQKKAYFVPSVGLRKRLYATWGLTGEAIAGEPLNDGPLDEESLADGRLEDSAVGDSLDDI